MNVRKARLGALDARVVAPRGHAPGGAGDGSTEKGGPVVVLLHGFGAPGTDLVGLAAYLDAPPGTRFVFPEAPIDLGPMFGGGRAWWMIDMVALQMAMATGTFRDLARETPLGLTEARAKLSSLLDAVDETLEPSQLVLGGFSQGAMLATDLALRSERPLAALILFSGTVIAEREWAPLIARRRGLPVALSHGLHDPILPYQGAERLRALLEEGGLLVDFTSFPGMHEIPAPALDAAGVVLKRALGSAPSA